MSYMSSNNARVVALKIAQDLIDHDALRAHPSMRDEKRPMLIESVMASMSRTSRRFVNVPEAEMTAFCAFCLDVKHDLLADRAVRRANFSNSYARARFERFIEPIINAHVAP